MTTEELIRKVGDPKTLSRELRQASADTRALEARWDELVTKHPDEWVGVQRKEFLFADTLDELIEKAREQGWDVGAMVVDRLNKVNYALLL
jgi:hypothetical protein